MQCISFRSDPAVYDKFKIICTIKKEKVFEKITELMKEYVSNNEELINNPKIQENIAPELPSFFDEQSKWLRYIGMMDENVFEKSVYRVTFLKYLHNYYVTQHQRDVTLYENFQFEHFQKSEDYKYLAKNHIYSTIKGLTPSHVVCRI